MDKERKQIMRNLTATEVAAMWFFHEEYATSGLGAIEFYKRLDKYDKANMQRMVNNIILATKQGKR